MRYKLKIVAIFSCILMLFCTGCQTSGTSENDGGSEPPKKQKVLALPEEQDWIHTLTFNEESEKAWLQPIWYTREIYDESVVIIGEEGTANLLYEPKGKVIARNYFIDEIYEEGVDFEINGKTIKRIDGGALPYWKVDEYFIPTNNSGDGHLADPDQLDFELDGPRRLYYREGTTLTRKQLLVSYRTDEMYDGPRIEGQSDRVAQALERIKAKGEGKMVFFGDSITEGYNASGSNQGGNVNPHMPLWQISLPIV